LNSHHRLLDVWCAQPHSGSEAQPTDEWKTRDWKNTIVHLHPQLRQTTIRDKLRGCVLTLQPFDFNHFLKIQRGGARLDATLQSCLLPLWESPEPFESLVRLWQQLHPVNPVTLAPTHDAEAFLTVKRLVLDLEQKAYLMVEKS